MKASGWSTPAEIPEPEQSRFLKVNAFRSIPISVAGWQAACLPARLLVCPSACLRSFFLTLRALFPSGCAAEQQASGAEAQFTHPLLGI